MVFLKRVASWLATIAAIVLGTGIAVNMFLPGSPAAHQFNMMVSRFLTRVLNDEQFLGMIAVLVILIFVINKLGKKKAEKPKRRVREYEE